MAEINLQGTKFAISILPLGVLSGGFWAKTNIIIQNEFINYQNRNEDISKEELENWIFAMFRFLAGGFGKERSISFEKAGIAVDFYPYTANGEEVSRHVRRQNDCVMAIRVLMRSK